MSVSFPRYCFLPLTPNVAVGMAAEVGAGTLSADSPAAAASAVVVDSVAGMEAAGIMEAAVSMGAVGVSGWAAGAGVIRIIGVIRTIRLIRTLTGTVRITTATILTRTEVLIQRRQPRKATATGTRIRHRGWVNLHRRDSLRRSNGRLTATTKATIWSRSKITRSRQQRRTRWTATSSTGSRVMVRSYKFRSRTLTCSSAGSLITSGRWSSRFRRGDGAGTKLLRAVGQAGAIDTLFL